VLRLLAVAGLALVAALGLGGAPRAPTSFAVERLVSDGGIPARTRDASLVNAWGLAAEPGGAWWTANEANDTSTLYSASGRKQLLTVAVDGGPTGIAFYGGREFRVSAGGVTDSARFVYACEDGTIRAWSPTVPHGWSRRTEIAVDLRGQAAIFRGLAVAGQQLYVTDFHNARVVVFDNRWRQVRIPGAFVDRGIPAWYAPFGIAALGDRVFVTYVWRAPVDGNDAPTGGYVDEFDLNGKLVARVAGAPALNAPWGLALAPRSFGRVGGDLLIGNFGDGTIDAYRRANGRWAGDGELRRRDGKPLMINGLWALAFREGRLFFTSGPHAWRGATELQVHGLLGSIAPAA
jgi:uncharacterized protein (TIGR03118 family)